jgi:replicative DNA helicase
MLDNGVLPSVSALISEASFYDIRHRRAYQAAASLWPDTLIDPVSIYEHCGKGIDIIYLNEIMSSVATSTTVEHYARIVADRAIVRRIIGHAQTIIDRGLDNPQDVHGYASDARQSIAEAGEGAITKLGLTRLSDGLSTITGEILDNKGVSGRLRTGFIGIDRLVGGLYQSLLTVLAGRPSMGKSSLALNIAINIALGGHKVAYFSLEDARPYLQRRALARLAQIPLSDIIDGRVKSDRFQDVIEATRKITGVPLWISDRGMSSDQITQSCWAHHARHGLDLIVIDHLGYVSDPGKEYEVVSAATRTFANLAKELECCVLLLVQLNRGGSGGEIEGKIPRLSNLRGSGKIEEDARSVWFAHRPWHHDPHGNDPHDFQLIVAKTSHGPTGVVKLWADFSTMFFRDPNERTEY